MATLYIHKTETQFIPIKIDVYKWFNHNFFMLKKAKK